MKPEGARYQAATQVKGLSPENPVVSEADAVHLAEGNSITTDRRGCDVPTGSETAAWYQKDRLGTRETQSVSRSGYVLRKPMNGEAIQMTLWESDQPIVSEKFRNGNGEKGLTTMRRDGRDTSSTLRGGQKMTTKLSSLTERARGNPRCRFTALAHLLTEDFLEGCLKEVRRDVAVGIDGVAVKEYEEHLEENIKDLVKRLKAKRYHPQPVKRAYIAKPNGGMRPLGVPCVEDKVVQMGMKKILEAIFEVDFRDVSYGFRPNRSCHDALDALNVAIMSKPVNWVVDMDIEKFFDTVDHKWLMECLKQRIADPSLLRLIKRFLKAGVMEEGKYYETDKGTPQGGILSPILANIYLHYILDLWFEKVVRKQMRGYARLTRYADDFIGCFQSEREGKEFAGMLKQRLSKFGLKIAQDKSRVIEFGRHVWERAQREGKRVGTFDFLGFTHYCCKTRKGKFMLGRKTSGSRFRQKVKAVSEWLKGVRNLARLNDWWKLLKLKLTGHYRYYGVSGNMQALQKFHYQTTALVYKWINRRSQKKSYNWKQFQRFLHYNPLPAPKIYHFYPVLATGGSVEEPNAGKLHVRF
jgi:group II intron reverse transcriptase/maturase